MAGFPFINDIEYLESFFRRTFSKVNNDLFLKPYNIKYQPGIYQDRNHYKYVSK